MVPKIVLEQMDLFKKAKVFYQKDKVTIHLCNQSEILLISLNTLCLGAMISVDIHSAVFISRMKVMKNHCTLQLNFHHLLLSTVKLTPFHQ